MSPEPWAEVDAIVTAALALAEDRQAAYVAGRCDGRPMLQGEVESLLAAHLQAGAFIETDAWTEDDGDANLPCLPPIGSRVGPYRLMAQIGCGGMGTVYRAERDDGQVPETGCHQADQRQPGRVPTFFSDSVPSGRFWRGSSTRTLPDYWMAAYRRAGCLTLSWSMWKVRPSVSIRA